MVRAVGFEPAMQAGAPWPKMDFDRVLIDVFALSLR